MSAPVAGGDGRIQAPRWFLDAHRAVSEDDVDRLVDLDYGVAVPARHLLRICYELEEVGNTFVRIAVLTRLLDLEGVWAIASAEPSPR